MMRGREIEDCDIVTGVVVARTDFVKEHPQAVETFLSEYEASVAYTNDNVADAAELIAGYGIVAKVPLAERRSEMPYHIPEGTGNEGQCTRISADSL